MKQHTLNINTASCIKCGKCVKVCPTNIFTQEENLSQIELVNIESCITCGHCVAVCPNNSVLHSEFPIDKIHPIDYTQIPTPEQMMLLCKVRRSNRAFSTKPIPSDTLDMILEAAHRAPTASNQQQVAFTLITDPEKLTQITDFTLEIFASVVKKLENPFLKPILKLIIPALYKYVPSFHRQVAERKKGNDLILRGATAVIFIHTPKGSILGSENSNLAYQNGSLMAECLGVSQFYTGLVFLALKQDKKKRLAQCLGINGTIHAGIALGMPAFRFPQYIDKREINVNKI